MQPSPDTSRCSVNNCWLDGSWLYLSPDLPLGVPFPSHLGPTPTPQNPLLPRSPRWHSVCRGADSGARRWSTSLAEHALPPLRPPHRLLFLGLLPSAKQPPSAPGSLLCHPRPAPHLRCAVQGSPGSSFLQIHRTQERALCRGMLADGVHTLRPCSDSHS